LSPSTSADLELMRAAMLLDSDPADSARRASAVLASSPEHGGASLLLANACQRLGDAARALAVLEPLAAAQPAAAVLQLELGRAYRAAARRADAIAAWRRAVALAPGLADGWRELALELEATGDWPAGDRAYAHFLGLARDPPELGDARVALADQRLDAAAVLLRERLRRAPADTMALRMLADVATRREDYAESARLLRECLALAPGDSQARFDLARVLYADHRSAEVLPHLERLLVLDPANTDYLNLRAQTLRLVGRNDEAIAQMERTVELMPSAERSWLVFGHLLREVGQQARAIDAYQHALGIRPDNGEAYWSLANLKTYAFTAAQVADMRSQLARGEVRGSDRTHLEFALGKALEDAGEYAESFEHYARGNALMRMTVGHDAEAAGDEARRARALYTPGFFAARSGFGSARADPIFIVGLPRSGSTLLEQILACHPGVEGTRELTDLPAVVAGIGAGAAPPYPESVASLDRAAVAALAADYLSRTATHRTLGRPRFVDKMLLNYAHIGLIHLMFPQAAIIDARRHPLGCGFSCYKQLFARSVRFSYDLAEMGRHYREYAELMAHYDAVLPGRVHRVHYEHLVRDPEGEVRRLLDYCGLPFDAACLRFYDSRRVVQTISSEQVRLPIYTESVDQWRHYLPWLGPMQDVLADLVAGYPRG